MPIKKATSKLKEEKRKAVNTVIVFIPVLLSFILSLLYLGILEGKWFDPSLLDMASSVYVLCIAIYAVFSKVLILIKGCKTDNSESAEMSKETISYIKSNIKQISKSLKVDEDNLKDVVNKIDKLLSIRDDLKNNSFLQDIAQTEKLSNQICELEQQKQELNDTISNKKIQIENYKQSITI